MNKDNEALLPWKNAHQIKLDVRWGDMDAMGHVNNVVYFRYFEQARVDWLKTFDIHLHRANEGPVVVHASCDFMTAIYYPAQLYVRTIISKIGRSSFQTEQRIYSDDYQQCFAQGKSVIAWIDFTKNQSIPLPESLRQRLNNANSNE